MSQFNQTKFANSRIVSEYGYVISASISIIALLLTFVVTLSELHFHQKISAFVSIVAVYLIVFIVFQTIQRKQFLEIKDKLKQKSVKDIFDSDVDEKLLVLEEAGKFFGASLKSKDMFRLISGRIGEIIPFESCAFFLLDENLEFSVPFAAGAYSILFENIKIKSREGIAGKAFLNGQVEMDKNLMLEKKVCECEFLNGLRSAMAVPLFRGEEVFCVLVLYGKEENSFDENTKVLAEAVGERITPLIIGSYTFEKSLANALTDSLTNLPNERAFYLVLENQIAEAQRFAEQRSLTILAIDIKNFDELNQKYGHSTGDRVLAFSAELIKKQLRRMDMLSRTVNDEFLVILPTATDGITEQIIKRIEHSFENNPYKISDNEDYLIEFNFGSATFLDDGETAEQLLKIALLRKRQTKNHGDNSVIFFPKQYVN